MFISINENAVRGFDVFTCLHDKIPVSELFSTAITGIRTFMSNQIVVTVILQK